MTTPDTAVPRLIVVDDTDPAIQYSPQIAFHSDATGLLDGQGWGGPAFNRTLTGLIGITTNGSISYNFNGTFVRALVAATGFNFGWECSVDGHTITGFQVNTSQVTNYIACDSGATLAGSANEHILNVDLLFLPGAPTTSTLWLDAIQYEPVPSDPLDAVTLRVHNSDPSVIYSNSTGGWQSFPLADYTNATAITGMSVTFSFNGTSASLYSVRSGYPNPLVGVTAGAFYSIDGKSPTNFDLPASTSVASTSPQFANIANWELFATPNLPPSQHSLQLSSSYGSSTSSLHQSLGLSYFIIKTNPATNSGGNSSTSGSGRSQAGSSLHDPVGAIAGGVVGGVAAIIAVIIIIFFIRKRHKKSQYQHATFDLNTSNLPSGNYYPDQVPQEHTYTDTDTGLSSAGILVQNPPPTPFGPVTTPGTYSRIRSSQPNDFARSPHDSGTILPSTLYLNNQDQDGSPMFDASSVTRVSQLPETGFNPSRLVAMKNAQSMKVRDEHPQSTEVRSHTDTGVRLGPPLETEVISDAPPTYTQS
ncbi:hypothetical protein D9757_000451 [Collybiopsis confluens]|uniref:Peptidase A1 domain-containing protein n=1 Tax=Collybiopsis confluens TaxID=2823264 RepID=A0A8H5I1N1_9AGAR|nr:hypothetical protein D9757_000451 [Collybiopsis confluens]